MAYCTVEQVKENLGLTSTADDALIERYIAEAQAAIDAHCQRVFEAVEATRYYSADDVTGDTLYLDDDIISVIELRNGDVNATVIPEGGYVLIPRNRTPAYAIKLKSPYVWLFDLDCEVAVEGLWGYSETAPRDICHACARLAAYYYRQKDAQVFSDVGIMEYGRLNVALGMPADVIALLEPYKRRGIA